MKVFTLWRASIVLGHDLVFETTDPRDSVFAQRNINPLLTTIVPRYEDSLAKVLMDATLTVLRTARIWHCFASSKHFETTDIPSWAIDFASKKDPIVLSPKLYNSALRTNLRVRLEETSSLTTAAFLTDRILMILPEVCPSPEAAASRVYITSCLRMVKEFLRNIAAMKEMPFEPTDPELLRIVCADCTQSRPTRRCAHADLSQLQTIWLKAQNNSTSREGPEQPGTTVTPDETPELPLSLWIYELQEGFNFGITERGRCALVPKNTMKGDAVAILAGCLVPVIVRPSDTRSGRTAYRRIGVAYIHGTFVFLVQQF